MVSGMTIITVKHTLSGHLAFRVTCAGFLAKTTTLHCEIIHYEISHCITSLLSTMINTPKFTPRPTLVAMVTKFEDKIGYNSACIRDIFEIVAYLTVGFKGRAVE